SPWHGDWTNCVTFSPDGKTIASGGADGRIRLWEAATGKGLRALVGHDKWVKSLAFSPDGKTLASTGADGTIRLWDVPKGKELHTIWGAGEWWVTSVAFSLDGKKLVTGSDERDNPMIRLWDVSSGKELARISPKHRTKSVVFSPDGKTLASDDH